MPRFLSFAVLLFSTGCAMRSGGTDAGPVDASAADGSATDAARDAGTIDSGPACPATAPADATPCPVESQGCTYDACPGPGVTQTSCTGGTWLVTTLPCGAHRCDDGSTCAADMVCVNRASGAVITTCEPNPCGSGPFDCSCATSLCRGGTCATSGTEVMCVIDCGGCP